MKKEPTPRWWQLDSLMIAMMAVLFLITIADVRPLVRQLLEIGTVTLGYVLISLWIYMNADALEAEARRKESEVRQPWHPAWWRPGLNTRQRHYLAVIKGTIRPASKENLP